MVGRSFSQADETTSGFVQCVDEGYESPCLVLARQSKDRNGCYNDCAEGGGYGEVICRSKGLFLGLPMYDVYVGHINVLLRIVPES